MKICCACGKEKELTKFYRNTRMKDGHFARCKRCFVEKKLCRQGRPFKEDKDSEVNEQKKKTYNYKSSFLELRLVNTSKNDYEETYKLLEKLGYNVLESVHNQFCEKYGLTPSEPKIFKNYFSAEDCGMT